MGVVGGKAVYKEAWEKVNERTGSPDLAPHGVGVKLDNNGETLTYILPDGSEVPTLSPTPKQKEGWRLRKCLNRMCGSVKGEE